jgi:hypothetical protein
MERDRREKELALAVAFIENAAASNAPAGVARRVAATSLLP